jgi:predicted esterase
MSPGRPTKPWSLARGALLAAALWSPGAVAQPAPDGGSAEPDPIVVGDSTELPDDGPTPSPTPEAHAQPDEPLPTRPNVVTGTTRPVRARMFGRSDDRLEHERLVAAQRVRRRRNPADPEQLELPGIPDAWFFRPRVGGRARVFVYLHARGADPRENCARFAPVVTQRGWLVCPQGPGLRGDGHRVWNNNATLAHSYTMASLDALSRRFPRRVRRNDNVVMGFSEGAFVAMQTGLMEPVVFPRWVIFAAHDGYVGMNTELYPAARRALRRVYLLTGAGDGIVERTRRAAALMRRERLGRIELRILAAAGHQLPPDFVPEVRRALGWVTAIR